MKIVEDWNENTGVAKCTIYYKSRAFEGVAQCHPNDEDMQSHLTGLTIANLRAELEYLKYEYNKTRAGLDALNQLYYSMNRSKNFNEKSYENSMLQRQIHQSKFALDTISKMLASTKQEIKTYIEGKEQFYQSVRKKRAAKTEQLETENFQNI